MEAIDIVSNLRRAIDIRRTIPSVDPEIVMQAGVWETAVEGVFLSGDEISDTWRAFNAAEEAGVEPVVLLPGASDVDASFSADVQAAIDVDLNNGYAVIAPRILGSIEEAGWWRVDLRTGETVGQIRDGRGSAGTEWAKVLGVVVGGSLLGVSGAACASNQANAASRACCGIANTLLAIATFLIAGALFPGDDAVEVGVSVGSGAYMDVVAFNFPIGEWCDDAFGP